MVAQTQKLIKMNQSHQLQTSELKNFESKTQIAGQFGNGHHKSLNIKTIITINNQIVSQFTVEERNKEIYVTDNLELAILAYNGIN
jgi:hypothetical protein